MQKGRISKKRPCKVCRRWFTPHPRAGYTQKTCASEQCKKEWHRRMCFEWDRKNSDYFKGIYLKNKMLAADEVKRNKFGKATPNNYLDLPWPEIQEEIGVKQVVIIEYIVQLLIRRFQEQIKVQLAVNTS